MLLRTLAHRVFCGMLFGSMVALSVAASSSIANGQDSETEPVTDARLGPLRSLNSDFSFKAPATLDEWKQRKALLRTRVLVALGLFPEPTRTPLKAVIHGKKEFAEYTIEKVYFESMPGFFVTGNLYKPKTMKGKVPGVLCPHGHHRDGRFRNANEEEISQQIANGSEKFRLNAKSPLQSRCIHLAKLGCVVFHYDMLGYADNQQIGFDVAHRFSKQREGLDSKQKWGLFSARAESYSQSVMGLQTWNSIRSLDFLESLPEVDASRIGVTGASGGGTQTFILCALDDRPKVSFPAVMVSTAMQGGCTCENCCYLRIGSGNVEFAAMFAPKPLGLTAANDWTINMSTKGFPQLQKIYAMYNAVGNVELTSRTEFNHNYNQISREAMYRWFSKHLGLTGATVESKINYQTSLQLTVFAHPEHKKPVGGEVAETTLLKWWQKDVAASLQSWVPSDKASLARFRKKFALVVDALIRRNPDSASELAAIEFTQQVSHQAVPFDEATTLTIVRSRNKIGELHESHTLTRAGHKRIALLAVEGGAAVLKPSHQAHHVVRELLNAGFDVAVNQDLFIDRRNRTETRVVENHRETAVYTLGYNFPQVIKRTHGWLPLVQSVSEEDQDVFVIGLDQATIDVALAVAHSCVRKGNAKIKGVVLNTNKFRFENVDSIRDPFFLPGGARYFDLPGFLSVMAPIPMRIYGDQEMSIVKATYAAAGASDLLEFKSEELMAENYVNVINVIDWLKSLSR